jgi:hypothetical protein
MEWALSLPISTKQLFESSFFERNRPFYHHVNYNNEIDKFFSQKYKRLSPILTSEGYGVLLDEIIQKNLQPKYTKNLRRTLMKNYNV